MATLAMMPALTVAQSDLAHFGTTWIRNGQKVTKMVFDEAMARTVAMQESTNQGDEVGLVEAS